jgi:RND family efflux transporter MFP subunit
MNKIAFLFIQILIVSILCSCKNKEENIYGNKLGDIDASSDPIKVEGVLSYVGDFPLELVSNGKLLAVNKASLSFQTSGIVRSVMFRNGDNVGKGELIAEMENSMEKLELEQARLRLERARIDRLGLIVGHRVGAQTEEDVPPEALKRFNMQSGYSEAQLAMEQAEIRYNYTRLTAPFTGRLANLETKPNNSPEPGKPFCLLIDDSRFEVRFPVMESEISRLSKGQEISMKPFFMDSVYYRGTITEVNPLIDENGMVDVKAIVNNTDKKLVDGMNVKVFIRDKIPDCLVVPKEAVVLRNNRQVVFSLMNDTLAKWNYVTTNLENSESYSIVDGLNPGDTVITVGNLNLAHEARIDFTLKEN